MREQMLKIADRLDKRAEAIFDNLFREYERERSLYERGAKDVKLKAKDLPPLPYPKSQMAGALVIMAEEIRETLVIVSFREYTGGGDLFTVKEFTDAVESGAFIDSDGMGFYAKEHPGKTNDTMLVSSLPARPSRIGGGDVNNDYTHVAWYNK